MATISNSSQVLVGFLSRAGWAQKHWAKSSTAASANWSEAHGAVRARDRDCRASTSTVKATGGKVLPQEPWGSRLHGWFILALRNKSSRAPPKGQGQWRKSCGGLGGHLPRAARGGTAGGRIWTGAKERKSRSRLRFEGQDKQTKK